MKKDKNYTLLTQAYSNHNGCYIGDEKEADVLFNAGITPQPARPEHKHCSIGFCEKEQKWYGWSHRSDGGSVLVQKLKKVILHTQLPTKKIGLKKN